MNAAGLMAIVAEREQQTGSGEETTATAESAATKHGGADADRHQ